MSSQMFRSWLPLALLVSTLTAAPAVAGPQEMVTTSGQESVSSSEAATARAQPASVPFVRTELFFGTNRPDGMPPVSDDEFRRFLDEQITPRFPDGLTLLPGLGQFRTSNGVIVQERSLVLVLLYPAESQKASSRKIERIRTAYKVQFQQESVLRVDDPFYVWTSF